MGKLDPIIEKYSTYLGGGEKSALLRRGRIALLLLLPEHFGQLFADGVQRHLTFIFLYFIFLSNYSYLDGTLEIISLETQVRERFLILVAQQPPPPVLLLQTPENILLILLLFLLTHALPLLPSLPIYFYLRYQRVVIKMATLLKILSNVV